MLPIHEFILWNNCANNCQFCWQKKEKQSTLNEQVEAISLTIDYIKNLYNTHILIIGGEIFSETNNQIKLNLYNLFLHIINKMLKNEIDQCYINTNLLYKLDSLLIPILELFNTMNLIKRIHFTTSADDFGRFNNNTSKTLFYSNLKELRKQYPDLYIICNIILTNSFCDEILSDNFNIKKYMNIYQVDVNTIPYIKFGNIISAPNREKVFKTIIHLNNQVPGYGIKYCNNFLLNQNIILNKYSDNKLIDISANKSTCGHSENFKRCYSDSNECFICDCLKLKELMETM